uniref:Crinkler effector protein N-terminal domain-containing protein n=1 Tax=Rhizophagus irregularis (strain DAOM 181602 / DAOM 197198 / MUCL 43194) TaxID=747089 RepID=U9UR05_RHIID
MSSYSSLSRVLSPFRVQTKFEENSLPASPTLNPKRYTEIMLGCIVLGEKNAFPVDFDTGKTIGHLKGAIKEKKSVAFCNTDANDLKLWKVNIPESKKQEIYEGIDIKVKFGGEELDSDLKTIGHVFEEQPPSEHIHILVQPPTPATTEKGKRSLVDSDEGQNSKRAKFADLNIISTAHKIMEGIMKLDENESTYSNPKNFLSLPYPYLGEKLPIDRFAIDNNRYFNFMGRKEFRNVLEAINKLRSGTGYMKLFVYGTVGYGKSHILSAIACFLFRTGRRVVFLPDCRQLAVDPVDYVKSALFLAYHDDDAKINEINSCENFENIVDFCKKLQFKEKLYFIVDQMNALDEFDNTGVNSKTKQQIRCDIDKMSNYHYYIMSSSANNKSMLHLMQKQTGELKIKLYGGFNEEEMEEWWKKYSLPAMNDREKEQIKDITGKIPLFLNFLLEYSLENFEGAFAYLKQKLESIIQIPMTQYSENLLGNKHTWDRHVGLMSSFITNTHPKLGYRYDDYDHRYFYIDDDNICYYVCGLVRDSMAEYLFEKREMEIFTDIKWISRISEFKNNPSVKGFFVEKACIASIFRNGLMANRVNFKPGGMECFYNEEEIKFSSNEEKCMFYLPCCWNQEAIDGLLISQTKDKLYVAPVQITLNKDNHSDSERKFFSSIWPNLKPNLSSFEDKLEIMFIWITHRSGTDESVECITKETRNKAHEINPNYTRVVIGFGNVNSDINRYLSKIIITNNNHIQSQIVKIEETNRESDKETKEQKSAQRRRGRPKKSL